MTTRVTGTLRGLINPVLLKAAASPNYDIRNTLVVAGFPRSGTTWLAEVAAALPATAILFEPDNFNAVHRARIAGLDRNNFRDDHESWPEGEAFLVDVLSGRILNRWTTSDIPLRTAIHVRRWIVKFVRANQMISWLARTFPVPPPVLLVRHPCAVFHSWTRRSWPMLERPEPNPRFLAAYPQFKETIARLRTPVEFFAARWCMAHYHALQTSLPAPYQLVFYEHLLKDGNSALGEIFRRWQVPMPEISTAAMRRPSAKASSELPSNPETSLGSWRKHLDTSTVEEILRVLNLFDLGFYGGGPLPELTHASIADFSTSKPARP